MRQGGHKLQVFAVALAHGFADDRDRLLVRIDLGRLISNLILRCAGLRFRGSPALAVLCFLLTYFLPIWVAFGEGREGGGSVLIGVNV
jgi:hypothetical protein